MFTFVDNIWPSSSFSSREMIPFFRNGNFLLLNLKHFLSPTHGCFLFAYSFFLLIKQSKNVSASEIETFRDHNTTRRRVNEVDNHICSKKIFTFFRPHFHRDLRCLRNTIHANLFLTYILSALLWIIPLLLGVSMRLFFYCELWFHLIAVKCIHSLSSHRDFIKFFLNKFHLCLRSWAISKSVNNLKKKCNKLR